MSSVRRESGASELALAARALTRRFGSVTAVDRLDLEVPFGGVTAFLGPNGAGKTTTLRMLLGLLRPTEGRVWLLGRELRPGSYRPLADVGALVEAPSLYDHLTGRENLRVAAWPLGIPEARVEKVLEEMDLSEAAGRRAGEYSLGMRQRLGIALALLRRPRLLVLDEPTNGLDPAGMRSMRDWVRTLPRQRGVTVLLSSHLLGEVERVADRVVVLDRGRARFSGTVGELTSRRRGSARVQVDRPSAARSWLEEKGWPVLAEDDGELEVEAEGAAGRAELCRALIEGGFAVSGLEPGAASLEAAFLELTEGVEETQ